MASLLKDIQEPHLHDHLVPLPGGPWALWRWVCVRSAGFAASGVLRLGSADCTRAADNLLQIQNETERARLLALDRVNARLDALKLAQEWDNKSKRQPVLDAMQLLKGGKVPNPLGDASPEDEAINDFRTACGRSEVALEIFKRCFQAGMVQISQAIREVCHTKRFQEAILWQNRRAFHTGVKPLLAMPAEDKPRGSKQRQAEELVASYVQRYCVKNDTIGFFGPVGWAIIDPREKAITVTPAQDIIATRSVYFEMWGIDVLAEMHGKDEKVLLWIPPRRSPLIHIEETTVHLPLLGAVKLSWGQHLVLQACDGVRTAKEIAVDLVRTHHTRLKGEEEVYRSLKILRNMGLVIWQLIVPIEPHPEQTLRKQLERIGDASLRERALAPLIELEAARNAVAQAAGNPNLLDQALGNLEASFSRLTGEASTRSAGRTYAGRTLIYEDCRRGMEVKIGQQILDALGSPLSLLLTSARWFSYRVADAYRRIVNQTYEELVREKETPTIAATDLWHRIRSLLQGDDRQTIEAVESMFQDKWTGILSLPSERQHVEYNSEQLRPQVMAEFHAPRPGWQGARYHSPDVMIAASSAEAIRQDRYQLVLGELHLSSNSLRSLLFVEQHPSPKDLSRSVGLDLPTPGIMINPPKDWGGGPKRTWHTLASPNDSYLEVGLGSFNTQGAKVLPLGMLVVEKAENGLQVRTRDGKVQYDIMEVLSDTLMAGSFHCFKLLRPSAHTPRISFDRLIVSRETWSLPAAEMEFAFQMDAADRFVRTRRWAQAHGMPHSVFVKVPLERKPFYLDYDSPIYVDIFARIVRKIIEKCPSNPEIKITEMLPDLGETWLNDAENQLYTCELRIVALDLAA